MGRLNGQLRRGEQPQTKTADTDQSSPGLPPSAGRAPLIHDRGKAMTTTTPASIVDRIDPEGAHTAWTAYEAGLEANAKRGRARPHGRGRVDDVPPRGRGGEVFLGVGPDDADSLPLVGAHLCVSPSRRVSVAPPQDGVTGVTTCVEGHERRCH